MVRQLGIAALIITAAVACGEPGRPHAAEGRPPTWVATTCPAQADAANPLRTGGGVPADFTTAAVVRCRVETRRIPGEGTWVVQVTERAATPVPELDAMLRRPSDTTSAETACTLRAQYVPYFLLIDAEGEALLPTLPTTACDRPRHELTDFLESMPYRTVTETRLSHVDNGEGPQTGCAGQWQDTLTAASPAPAPHPAGDVHVCLYRVSGDTGWWDAGRLLTGADAAALRATLGAAGPAAPCDRPHTRFAVLHLAPNDDTATVELNGCLRFRRVDGTLGQLTPDVVAGLTR